MPVVTMGGGWEGGCKKPTDKSGHRFRSLYIQLVFNDNNPAYQPHHGDCRCPFGDASQFTVCT